MRPVWLVIVLLGLAACSEPPPVTCGPDPTPECESHGPDVVAGVDLRALFADPSPAEVDTVVARGQAEAPTDFQTALAPLAVDADGAHFDLLTLADPTTGDTLHALVRSPGPRGATSILRALVILPDGTDGASEDDLLNDPVYRPLAETSIQIVLAYRGEPLRFRGRSVPARGTPAPYTADVRDAVGLVNALRETPQPLVRVDARRVGLVGFGRGGTVAMLASTRTPAVRLVAAFGSVTDLFLPSVKEQARQVLRDEPPGIPLPAVEGLLAPVRDLRDGTIDRAEARLRLLARSPLYVLPAVAPLVAAHGGHDLVVPREHGDRLLGAIGHLTPTRQMIVVEAAGHEVWRDALAASLAVRVIQERL